MTPNDKQHCEAIISRFSLLSALATANPFPLGDTALVLLLQMWMLSELGKVKGIPADKTCSLELLQSLAARRISQYAVNELINVIPLPIPMLNAFISYKLTQSIGNEALASMTKGGV